jgi:hypothetical protein
MISLETITLITSAVGLLAVILLGAALAAERRQRRRQSERLDELTQKLEIFQQSLHALTASAAGADERMFRLEAQERLLSERQETIENQRQSEQPYRQAIRLVQQGAGVSRLMEELGLSESEAELIFRLHGLQSDGTDVMR